MDFRRGRFTGEVPLSHVLKHVGIDAKACEVVKFFGTDRGKEDVVFRENTYKLEQQFGRSITLEHAKENRSRCQLYALNARQPSRATRAFRFALSCLAGTASLP